MCTKSARRRSRPAALGPLRLPGAFWGLFEARPAPAMPMKGPGHKAGAPRVPARGRTRLLVSTAALGACCLLWALAALVRASSGSLGALLGGALLGGGDWEGIDRWDYSKGPWTVAARAQGDHALRIPRIVHQTFKSWEDVEHADRVNMAGWREMNPTWEFRYYDNVACDRFVREHYPEYLTAYETMPRNIERVDFFRYLVVLHHGGIYADTDVECRQPLDSWIDVDATFIAGVENEFVNAAQASHRQYARRKQLLQWTFASEPRSAVLSHVALRVDELSRNQTLHDMEEVYATYERTGPGIWTDAIYESINERVEAAQPLDGIRILPRVALGAFPNNADGVNAYTRDTLLLHHFRGSWKSKSKREKSVDVPSRETPALAHPISVRVVRSPPTFVTVFVDPLTIPRGYRGLEFGPTLSAFGTWQAGLPAMERPTVLEVLSASLHAGVSPLFVDVGANNGLLSLAMSSIGVNSIALVNRSDDLETLSLSAVSNGIRAAVLRADGPLRAAEFADGHARLTAAVLHADDLQDFPGALEDAVRGRSSRNLVIRYGGTLGAMLLRSVVRAGGDMQAGLTRAVLVEVHGSSGIGVDEVIDHFRRRFEHVYYAGRACNEHWRDSGRLFWGRHSKNYAEDPEEHSQSKLRWMVDELPTWCALPANAIAGGGGAQLRRLRESVRRLKPHRAENFLFLKRPMEELSLEGLRVYP